MAHKLKEFREKPVTTEHTPLKLRAEDHTDLKIFSAHLQDAILYPTTMHYHKDPKVFVLLANRFRWEHPGEEHEDVKLHQRIHSGIYFSHVHKIRANGIHPKKDRHQPLCLLAVHGDIDGEVHLLFSGGKAICLHVEKILCHLKDLDEPWWTHQKPEHALAA